MLYIWLEWMNINYQLNYEHAITIQKQDNSHVSIGTHVDPRGAERISYIASAL